ncbi:MAG TPA: hypothetical protein VGS78_02245 [Candidatus Sulfotelmatobacter sp.]|nr:hypothetical protein [Candidatus Sulfotelmatobacter sp.]
MIVIGWNNGGAGYGLRVRAADRDHYFRREWQSVEIELPNGVRANANIDKEFWGHKCRELISKEVGQWLRSEGLAPWGYRQPPKLVLEPSGTRSFVLSRGQN